jgi:hypothetical protein
MMIVSFLASKNLHLYRTLEKKSQTNAFLFCNRNLNFLLFLEKKFFFGPEEKTSVKIKSGVCMQVRRASRMMALHTTLARREPLRKKCTHKYT